MAQPNGLETLFKNIHKGVKALGVETLNEELLSIIRKGRSKKRYESKSKDNETAIKKIIQCVAEDFKLSADDILNHQDARPIKEARDVAACMLVNAGFSIRFVSKVVFKQEYHTFVTKAVSRHKTLNLSIKSDREYKERYDRIESAIKDKLNK